MSTSITWRSELESSHIGKLLNLSVSMIDLITKMAATKGYRQGASAVSICWTKR